MPVVRAAKIFALMATVLVVFLLSAFPASAQSIGCDASMSDIDFGTVSVRSGVSNETSGNLSVTCTGLGTVGVCVFIGAGGGGSGPGFSPHFMRRGDNAALAFQLRPVSNGAAWDRVFVQVPIAFGTGSVNVPVLADIVANRVGVGTGFYNSTFAASTDIAMEFNTSPCSDPGMPRSINAFTVSATVAASCEVDAGTLDFGTLGSGTGDAVDASTTFFLRCTDTTAYVVRLDNGMGVGATGPGDRRLTGPTAQLRYGLYLDASRTRLWGDGASSLASGTGSGMDQGMTVFGRIYGGQPRFAGSYSDSVLITVEY